MTLRDILEAGGEPLKSLVAADTAQAQHEEMCKRLLVNTFEDYSLEVAVNFIRPTTSNVAGKGQGAVMYEFPARCEITAKKAGLLGRTIPAAKLKNAYQTAFKALGVSEQEWQQIVAVGSKVSIPLSAMQALNLAIDGDGQLEESAIKRNQFLHTVLIETGAIDRPRGGV